MPEAADNNRGTVCRVVDDGVMGMFGAPGRERAPGGGCLRSNAGDATHWASFRQVVNVRYDNRTPILIRDSLGRCDRSSRKRSVGILLLERLKISRHVNTIN